MAEEKIPSFLGQPEEVKNRKYNNLFSDLTSQTVGGRSFSDVTKAIENAEVGGDRNATGWPYIFTKSSDKSSAFGPAQILYSTALSYFYDGANERERRDNMEAGNFKKGYTQLPAEVKSYVKRFIEQGIKKRNRKGGVYGNLGVGDISREDHEKYYPFLFGVHVKEKKKIAKDDSMEDFVKAHYGNTKVLTETGEVDIKETKKREKSLSNLQTKVSDFLKEKDYKASVTAADRDEQAQQAAALEIKKAPQTKPEPIVEPEPVVEQGTTDTQEPVYIEDEKNNLQVEPEESNISVPETPASKNIDLPKKTEKEGIMDMLFGLFGKEKEPVQESPVVEDPAAEGLKLLGGHRQRTLSTSSTGMARGGMAQQMSMFDEGGLLDQGGETDPVSGNDVPPGSLKEEVRDDIPAQLSEGEFVFPADVVRYIGLEKLMQMRQEAKMGLKRMEDMGQMGNSDEATMPDDLPFTLDDLDVDDEPQMFQAGGVVQPAGFTGITDLQASQFAPAPQQFQQFGYTPPPPPPTPQAYVPTQQATIPTMEVPSELPTFEQLIPASEGRYDELIEFENKETGQKMSIPFVDGQPIYPIPNGFTRVPTDIIKPEVPETVVPTARVESAVDDGDDEAQRRREAEEEAMYGPGGGRVALGGELYTGPTKFVGDNIRTRLVSGTVRGATKVGVSFNTPGNPLGLAGGLAFGKGIPENATATFFLNGATYTVNSEMYNRMKENKFRGDESNSILAKLKDARAIMTEKKVSAKDAETILDIREKLESSKAEQDDLFLEAFEAGEERREAERRLKEMQEREEARKRQLEAERRRAEQETKDMSYQEKQQYREERESDREEQIKDSSGGRQEQDRIDNIRDDSERQREQERFDAGARQEAERQTYEETGIGGSDYAKMYGNKGGLASKPKPKVKKMKRGGLASKK